MVTALLFNIKNQLIEKSYQLVTSVSKLQMKGYHVLRANRKGS